MSFEPIWGAPIAWYLFLAGLGGGAYITSAFLRWRHPEAQGMRRAGHFIAPVAVAIGLVLLMVDAEAGLHNPLRFAQAVRFGHASCRAAGRATRASLQVGPVVRKPAFAQFVQNESGLHGGHAALREILFVARDDVVGAYLLGAA